MIGRSEVSLAPSRKPQAPSAKPQSVISRVQRNALRLGVSPSGRPVVTSSVVRRACFESQNASVDRQNEGATQPDPAE